VSEDLTTTCSILSEDHEFSLDQLVAIAEAMARFHAAGFCSDVYALTSAHSCLGKSALNTLDGKWIRKMVERSADPPALDAVRVVGQRYDRWMEHVAKWRTIIHTDIWPSNVALYTDETGAWRAKQIDLDAAELGIPQYDIEWMTMAGFNTGADWDEVRDHHFRSLQCLIPGLFDDEAAWRWGNRFARLQLMLHGTRIAVDRLDRYHRGEKLSDWELSRVRSTKLFDKDFIDACEAVIRSDPWADPHP
jgi:hypothetical protein